MKKIFIAVLIFSPWFASAALQVPQKASPLQPAPEGVVPSINTNINSPGSDYSQSQQQIQDQTPPENDDSSQPVNPVAAPVVVGTQSIAFYWALIIVCALVLVGVLAYVYYRYRRKD